MFLLKFDNIKQQFMNRKGRLVNPMLPFIDLPPLEADVHTGVMGLEAATEQQKNGITFGGEKHDATLMFMLFAVTLTAKNEMPIVSPFDDPIPKNILGLHRVSSNIVPPDDVAPHFFFGDERILSFWNNPFRTEKKLARFRCSISMDFSMTAEMSRPQKMYSSFINKLWAAWMQSRGHKVIPNVSFPDEYEEDYWIEGWPRHSVIAVSSVGVLTHGNAQTWLNGVMRIREELAPQHILRYGPVIDGEQMEGCTYFDNDNKRAANGWQWFI